MLVTDVTANRRFPSRSKFLYFYTYIYFLGLSIQENAVTAVTEVLMYMIFISNSCDSNDKIAVTMLSQKPIAVTKCTKFRQFSNSER